MKVLENKLKEVEQYEYVEKEEKELVNEILKDMNENFNNDNNAYTNQQFIGYIDLFRGAIVK